MAIGGQSTLWKHGTHAATGTATDYTSSTRSVSPSWDQETVDATVFGDAYKDFEASFKNSTISATYKYSTAMWTVLTDIYSNGDTVAFEIGPDGSTTGKPKITGNMFITKLDLPLSVGALEEISVSFQVTGSVTFTTY